MTGIIILSCFYTRRLPILQDQPVRYIAVSLTLPPQHRFCFLVLHQFLPEALYTKRGTYRIKLVALYTHVEYTMAPFKYMRMLESKNHSKRKQIRCGFLSTYIECHEVIHQHFNVYTVLRGYEFKMQQVIKS